MRHTLMVAVVVVVTVSQQVMFPTAFYGPLLGSTVATCELAGIIHIPGTRRIGLGEQRTCRRSGLSGYGKHEVKHASASHSAGRILCCMH